MDVMKPTLINIGGRCYRKMPFEQKIEHHSDQVYSSQLDEGKQIFNIFIKLNPPKYAL